MRALDPVLAGRASGPERRFAAYVAHELRTPIALQRALAEAALADPHPDLRAICEEIVAGCEEQQRLIDALIDLTRPGSGLAGRAPVDIAALAGRVLAAARGPSGLRHGVRLEPAVAAGDPTLLERLCANLVANAIRHNVPHGRIDVRTTTEDGDAVLAVANTGPLIPPGELARLFEPFERLGSGEGLGLGLSIVRAIADAHGAIVTTRARAGGGLAIEVRLPGWREVAADHQ